MISRRQLVKNSLKLSGASLIASQFYAPLVRALGEIPDKLAKGQSIYQLSGKISINGKPANLKSRIKPGDKIKASKGAKIIFAVGRDAHLLREDSEVELTAADSDTPEQAKGLNLLKGKLLSVYGKRKKQEVKLKTSTATIGIRGTGVYAESYPDYSYVCTCYGEVQITANSDGSATELVATQHHEHPRYVYRAAKDGSLIHKAPMKNHRDDELMLLETLVGRTPPFSHIHGYKTPRRGY